MNDETRDRAQRTLTDGRLFNAVRRASDALKSRSQYDWLTDEDRRFALLCWALERSADRPPLAPHDELADINLVGALTALDNISKGAF